MKCFCSKCNILFKTFGHLFEINYFVCESLNSFSLKLLSLNRLVFGFVTLLNLPRKTAGDVFERRKIILSVLHIFSLKMFRISNSLLLQVLAPALLVMITTETCSRLYFVYFLFQLIHKIFVFSLYLMTGYCICFKPST